MRLRSSLASPGGDAIIRTNQPRERRLLGDLLNLDPAQQEAVLQQQAETGQPFAEAAVELGLATDEQVRHALEQQQGFSVLGDGDGRVDPLVISAFDPDDVLSRLARNLRGILTAAVGRDGRPLRSVALIGRDTAAELPILVANLAVACAQASVPTLLVDADLDHPHQHGLFRVPNRNGLAAMLAGNDLRGLVQPAAIDGLSLLTAGQGVRNAPELFDRQRLANVVEVLAEDFELVLVDAGCETTAVSAATGLDAALLVLRRNVTYSRDVSMLVEQLEANGQTVLGTVLVD